MILYKPATGTLSRIISKAHIQALVGGGNVDIRDIDYIVNGNGKYPSNVVTLLDGGTGSVVLAFRP